MSPNTTDDTLTWIDPSSIYSNAAAFADLLDDITADLNAKEIDVVAGFDAIDFVLAAGIAAQIQRGFLPIRMEMRGPAFTKATRVLLVNQWIETGSTMESAIQFVEQQGGSVAGIVAIAIETNERTEGYRRDYKCVSAVLPGTPWQEQCDRQTLDSFANYRHEATFPTAGRS